MSTNFPISFPSLSFTGRLTKPAKETRASLIFLRSRTESRRPTNRLATVLIPETGGFFIPKS